MRSPLPIFILLIAGLSCVSCRSTHDPRASWSPQEGYEYLIVARRFALGGVGVAGDTSTGEYAFRAVLRSRGASQVFKLIFSPGAQATDEGKLYALCGIRATHRADFDSCAAVLVSTNPEVTTQSGCSSIQEKAGDVVKRIGAGTYDVYFSKR
jgi:hypothetical protein